MPDINLPDQVLNFFINFSVLSPLFIQFKTRYNKKITFFLYMLGIIIFDLFLTIFVYYMRTAFPDAGTSWITPVYNIICIVINHLIFKGKTEEKITMYVIGLITCTFTIGIAMIPANALSLSATTIPGVVFISLVAYIMHYPIIFLYLHLRYKKNFAKNDSQFKSNIKFLGLLLIQLYLFNLNTTGKKATGSEFVESTIYSNLPVYIVLIAASLVLDFIIFYLMYMERKRYSTQVSESITEYKQKVLSENSKQTSYDTKEFKDYLADKADKITEIKSLISQNMIEEAMKMVSSSVNTNPFGYKKFCNNTLVNILFSNKLSDIDEQIQTDIVIDLPETIPVNDLDLCKIFSNLLDNAFTALDKCENIKLLKIRVYIDNGHLYIRFENTCNSTVTENKSKDHGYGLSIIKEIAENYQGKLYIQKQASIYSALVVLKLKKQK